MPDIRHKHIRLPGHDYTTGLYFVTLCTNARAKVLGTIADDGNAARIELTDVGRIVDECWRSIPEHFPYARIGEMQVMPDHLHAILILGVDHGSTRWVDATLPIPPTFHGPRRGSLGAIIGAFKSETTKRVNRLNHTVGSRLWQRGYYERIIRDQEYERIASYIAMNPKNWR